MSLYMSWQALKTRDKVYLFTLGVIIVCIVFERFIPFPSLPFIKQTALDTRTLEIKNISSTHNQESQEPAEFISPTQNFPQNYSIETDDNLLYCEQIQMYSPVVQKCTRKDSKQVVLLNKQGSYPGGGTFNHYFNEQILKPYLSVPDAQLIQFQKSIWHVVNQDQEDIPLQHYIVNTISTKLKRNAKEIENALAIITTLKGEDIITLLENATSDAGKKALVDAYHRSIPDIDLVRNTYAELIRLPQHDPVYQKIRANYVFLRLFEIGNVLNSPGYNINITKEYNINYPFLSYSSIFGSPNGLLSSDQLVLDFYKTTTAEDMASPTLIPKDHFYNGKDQRLNIYYDISYRSIVEQIQILKNNFSQGGLVSLSTDTYPETIMVGKDFLNTYLVHFPAPATAKDRAYERARLIISLTETIFAEELKDPSAIDPSKKWADLSNPAFKNISDHILNKLAPQKDSYLFNPYRGTYQAPHDINERQEEVNDSRRWEKVNGPI